MMALVQQGFAIIRVINQALFNLIQAGRIFKLVGHLDLGTQLDRFRLVIVIVTQAIEQGE